MKKYLSFVIISILLLSFASCSVKDKSIKTDNNTGTQPVSYTKPVTKIYNDLADTLPDFDFKGELSETYDEGYSYSFSVKSSKTEFSEYVKALKSCGYSVNEVNGKDYFFAMNANGFKVECMYKNGNIVLLVSR